MQIPVKVKMVGGSTYLLLRKEYKQQLSQPLVADQEISIDIPTKLDELNQENTQLKAELQKMKSLLPSLQQEEFNAHAGIWSPHLAYSSPETLLGWAL